MSKRAMAVVGLTGAVCVLFFVPIVLADDPVARPLGTIEGKVVLQNGRPVYAAVVDISSDFDKNATFRVLSDRNGSFRLANIPTGRYTVVVTDKNGHKTITTVSVTHGGVTRIKLVLQEPL